MNDPLDNNDKQIDDDDMHGDSSVVSMSGNSSIREKKIGEKETAMVNLSKILVLVSISILAILIGYATFSFLKNQEKNEHQEGFDALADEIISITHIRSRGIFDNLEQVAVSLTAQARSMQVEWPFVVFPDFQVQGMLSNRITGADSLTIHPLVSDANKERWERFSVYSQGWLGDAHVYDQHVHQSLYEREYYSNNLTIRDEGLRWNATGIIPYVWKEGDNGEVIPLEPMASDWYSPYWQRAPVVDFDPDTNKDLRSSEIFEQVIQGMLDTDHPVMTEVTDATFLTEKYDQRFPIEKKQKPHIFLLSPIYDTLLANRTAVGFLSALFRFDKFFINILHYTESGIYVVLDGSCGQTFTFILHGHEADYVGPGNLWEAKYEDMRRDFDIAPFALLEETKDQTYCQYKARIYPSDEWSEKHFTNQPKIFALAIAGCFFITSVVFIIYEIAVQRRQAVVMESATKANQVVSSLFPSNVRDRVMEEMQTQQTKKKRGNRGPQNLTSSQKGSTCETSETIFGTKPIADLFPECTVMFADMVGFTAWSSEREPAHVFTLLETVYHAFDKVARRRRIFKVETVGDCYVAVCGLPEARKDHACAMARFAHEANAKMGQLVTQLEKVLGPDTGDLALRTGLHSGAVTAGVLRGDKGRFQLFGDTMNTAARMESTGRRDKIHLSKQTANLLIKAGKEHWVVAREDKVIAKGKGELQTFWLTVTAKTTGGGSLVSTDSEIFSAEDSGPIELITPSEDQGKGTKTVLGSLSTKKQRLVIWCVDILSNMLKDIIAQRMGKSQKPPPTADWESMPSADLNLMREATEVLELLPFDEEAIKDPTKSALVDLSAEVSSQLELFVATIASLHNDENPFHNFEHTSHMTMSVTKLLNFIRHPTVSAEEKKRGIDCAFELHKHSYGITSDPLVQFACVFSAIIHDVGHFGVTNATLVKENHPLAQRYKGTSIAEQNALNVTWQIFLRPEFKVLRSCICASEKERRHFQSTLATLALATDITDPTFLASLKSRWETAFSANSLEEESPKESTNRKATLVLEHLIQASDASPSMQHWHIFLKWNKRHFFEVYKAFLEGREDSDPSEFWYDAEIAAFDRFVIPLAKNLRACGVLGVSGEEGLTFAKSNREEWQQKGRSLVKDYVKSFEAQMNGFERMDST